MCLQSLMKFHHCLFKILRKNQNVVDKELQRAITLNRTGPSPYISIINVHLLDHHINVFAKFYEIASLLVQVIKERPKCCRLRITKGNNSKTKRIGPWPLFFYFNVHLVDINVFAKFYEIPSMPFQDIEKPKRRGWMDGQCENSIPSPLPTNTVCRGFNKKPLPFILNPSHPILLYTIQPLPSNPSPPCHTLSCPAQLTHSRHAHSHTPYPTQLTPSHPYLVCFFLPKLNHECAVCPIHPIRPKSTLLPLRFWVVYNP